MEYITAAASMADTIHHILHATIEMVYPKYCPKEVVEFFCQHHNREHILEGIASGNMGVLTDHGVAVGTGCYHSNHITGVYVLPNYQKQGYGSYIMDCLEAEIVKKYDTALLDASLSAVCLYEHRGYKTVGHEILYGYSFPHITYLQTDVRHAMISISHKSERGVNIGKHTVCRYPGAGDFLY